MSDDIKAGDVVVCVDDAPCRCCAVAWPIRRGAVVRVTAVGHAQNLVTGNWLDTIHFLGLPDSGNHPSKYGLNAARFRKLPPADESFTRQMRALNPHKVTA